MRPTGKVTDKLIFTSIYLVVALLVIWGAGRMINYAVDFGFYRDFLIPWEMRLMDMRFKSAQWPEFKRDQPVAYMQSVVRVMQAYGIRLPASNTRHPFTYRLNRFGGAANKVLLVFNDNKLTLYGLPMATFNRLDRFVDGEADLEQGHFTGQLSKDRMTMIGFWKF